MTSAPALTLNNYSRGARAAHLDSKGYLEALNSRLGFPSGTLYGICMAAMKSKTKSRGGLKVTYRGETERQISMNHTMVSVRKAVFLIEFKMTRAGKQVDRVIQVHLEV